MKAGLRNALVSSAVLTTLYGPSAVLARDLIWDPSATTAATGSDGPGSWDTIAPVWVDLAAPGSNTAFVNGDSVRLGTTPTATTDANGLLVTLSSSVTAQNIIFANAASGAAYNLTNTSAGEVLTLGGNFIKSATRGTSAVQLTTGIVLATGTHVFSATDSSGDTSPELTFSSALTGSGSVVIDNSVGFAGAASDIQYGTTAFTGTNTYTGGTTVQNGRLIANSDSALGTGMVNITSAGALSFGGANTAHGDLTVNNAINISRNDYTTAVTNNRYTDAVNATADGTANTITLNGTITVNSTEARIAANSNRIIITQPLVAGATGATSVLSLGGNFSGFVELTGDNTAYGAAGGTIGLRGGVELQITSESQLGGPTSKLRLAGGTIKPGGPLGADGSPFMTNFGAHDLSSTPVNTGVNLDAGQTFTVNNFSGTSIGTRGLGTINFTGTNTFTGIPYFDGGVVNFAGGSTTALGAIRLRSPVVNIAGAVTLNSGFTSIGADTTGTNGGPDKATLNITGSGSLVQTGNQDFNIADNGKTEGTVVLSDSGKLTTVGQTWIGRGANTRASLTLNDSSAFTAASLVTVGQGNNSIGTVTQNGGSITLNRNGDFTFVLGDGRDGRVATGNYTLSNGTFTSAGEVYVGEGAAGTGTWTQTGGTANVNSSFVVGRESGLGTVTISGGTLNKGGINNFNVGVANNTRDNKLTLSGTGVVNVNAGEFWIGNGGGKATLAIQDSSSLTTNNWFAVGRQANSIGIVNQDGGTVTKTGTNFLAIGSGGTGTYNQNSGVLSSNGSRIGEASSGTYNVTGGTATFTGELTLGNSANVVGAMNISGTANVSVPDVVMGKNAVNATNRGTGGGTISLNGGTLTANSFKGGAAGGSKVINFNGGLLRAASSQADFISATGTPFSAAAGALVGTGIITNVLEGGAKISSNGFDVTVNTALVHSGAAATDGGLAKSGPGTMTLTGSNTYTGVTTITGGTLRLATASQTPVLGTGAAGADIQAGAMQLDYTGTTSPVAHVKSILDAGYAGGFATSQIRSTTLMGGRTIGYGDDGLSLVTIKVTLPGDANVDGKVDFNDFLVLQNNFNKPSTRFDQGNFNYDGSTDFNDFLMLQNNFGQSVTGTSVAYTQSEVAALTAFAAAVPEPTALAAVGLSLAAGLHRRRRAN